MWDKKLWGIEYTTLDGRKIIISNMWHHYSAAPHLYPGEPSRAMLFTTRKTAREWMASESHYSVSRRYWRVVRVRETVRKI